MCGRFSLAIPSSELEKVFQAKLEQPLQPRYNIAPQQDSAVILNETPKKISMLRWGLVPHWAKDESVGFKLINARAESVADKPSFRSSMRDRRCLVLADGFYEWKKTAAGKIPFRFTLKDGRPFGMAGLWDTWKSPDDKELRTFTIITTTPNSVVKKVHDRMPVIIGQGEEQTWLNGKVREALALLKPYGGVMEEKVVSKKLNNPANEGADLLKGEGLL